MRSFITCILHQVITSRRVRWRADLLEKRNEFIFEFCYCFIHSSPKWFFFCVGSYLLEFEAVSLDE